ncbi:spore germination protein [Niallia sp. FSL W8-0951]|uniref:spore germination protein n=1 Tax=Niallia sp. FSL W8-0951 TaxID=2954639 RepID=UPI0030F73C16
MDYPLFTSEALKQLFNESSDIIVKEDKGELQIIMVYCVPLTDTSMIKTIHLPEFGAEESDIYQYVQMESFNKKEFNREKIQEEVFSGKLLVIPPGEKLYLYDIKKFPSRQPDESVVEVSAVGPKDGFVEDINTNIGLIRKRLRTSSFVIKEYTIGKRTNTKVGLLYMNDIVNNEILADIKKRLSQIDIDVLTSSNILTEYLAPRKFSLIPTIHYSGRADFIVQALNQGRFAIVVDGSPTALIAPVDLSLLFKSAEDENSSFYYTSLQRTLRIIGIFTTILLPGFYTAIITHHVGQLPLPILATISVSRLGLPFSPLIESLLMVVMFELFFEAGSRLPKGIGQTVSVLGGLIIGDAAIRGGITSPSMLVIIGITALTSFTLVNRSLAGNLFYFRVFVLLISYFLGIYGFFLSFIFIILYIARLDSFGIPMFSNITTPYGKDILFTFLRIPNNLLKKRNAGLSIKDGKRKGD